MLSTHSVINIILHFFFFPQAPYPPAGVMEATLGTKGLIEILYASLCMSRVSKGYFLISFLKTPSPYLSCQIYFFLFIVFLLYLVLLYFSFTQGAMKNFLTIISSLSSVPGTPARIRPLGFGTY